jgi:DnaB helicase-like protein
VIDLEYHLLKMYTDEDKMRRMMDLGLREENVASLNEDAAAVFRTAKGWWQRNGVAVPSSVLLEDHEQYVKTNSDSDDDVEEADPQWVVKKLQIRYLRLQFKSATDEANKAGTFDDDQDYDEQLEKAKGFVTELRKITVNSTSEEGPVSFGAEIEQFVKETLEYEDDVASGRVKPPVSFGFDPPPGDTSPDTMYQGLRRGELALFSAYLKGGKTHLCCKAALKAAMDGDTVALAALEPSKESVKSILAALASRLPMSHVEEKTLTPGPERERFRELVTNDALSRIHIWHPVSKGARTLEEMYTQAYDLGADLFVGDQFSHVYYAAGKNTPDWVVNDEKPHLARQLSQESKMASIWAWQLNRGASKKKDPSSSDLARSIGAGQASDFLFYLAKVDGNPDVRTLACRESRRGPEANWELTFRFDPMIIEVSRQIAL